MKQYIDKSVLVEKIEKRIKETETMNVNNKCWARKISRIEKELNIINNII